MDGSRHRRGDGPALSRRQLLAAGAAAGAGLALGAPGAAAAIGAPVVRRTVFASLPDGDGWGPSWCCPGVANLRVAAGEGLLEAGSDVFPNDPRPVAFAVDCRLRDAAVRADVSRPGSLAGVVLRRTAPRAYYAALYDPDEGSLTIVRRAGGELTTLARALAVYPGGPLTLELRATGASPTALSATVAHPSGMTSRTTAVDGHPDLQRAGDPGVLTRARTLFPSAGPPPLEALGNLHLLPYGVQEGQAFVASPAGQEVVGEIRRASTAGFTAVAVASTEQPQPTPASVIAATTGLPRAGGARLHVATDLPAHVEIEVDHSPRFTRPRRVAAGRSGAFDALIATARGLPPGRRVHWRATVRRAGLVQTGPVRTFPVLPAPGDGRPVRLAIAACGAQFGAIFDHLARAEPDVLVWQGDLNYPDTHGPLAQTTSAYAGIWRDFLANPRLLPVLERAAFVAMRDDHDYGQQDSNATTIPRTPWAVAPWDALLGGGVGVRFSAGAADVWVLDQRRFKSDPTLPDTLDKTLLGPRQRAWLLRGLARSRAPFKVVCSPCTMFMPFNARDGNWSAGFTVERDLVLDHVDRHVSGRTLFVTGDTHLTAVYDHDGRYEVRAAPIDIPVPNDVTLSDPLAAPRLRASGGVPYADERGHVALLDVEGDGDAATLRVSLLREDGATPYRRTFSAPAPAPGRSGR